MWEYGGTPWDKPENYAKWSPNNFAQEFHTPTLVIHGEQDFRVPLNQGLELFTALQLQKVPSKLRSTRDWSCSPPCNCKKCHRNCCSSPMKVTGF